MENDIEPWLGFDESAVNISDIGKYDKFVDFKVFTSKDGETKIELSPRYPYTFTTDEMVGRKLTESDRFLAMERMQEALDNRIEEELKENTKLQNKIKEIQRKTKEIQRKTKERIDKLKAKPVKKLREKYSYERFEKYFEPKLDS